MPSTASPYTLGAGLPAKLGNGPRTSYDVARVGAGLGRGPNQRMKLTAAAWSNTWPAPGATLDLDFVNNRGYVRGVGQGGVMDAITFTRASSGNWVGSDGLLKTGAGTFTGTANAEGKNLLTFPQDFDNAAWVKTNAVVSADATTAPDGTRTADFFSQNGTATTTGRQVSFTVSGSTSNGQSLVESVYLKASQLSWALVYWLQRDAITIQSAYINLSNGAVGTTTGGPTVTVSSSGDGWYRVAMAVNAGTGASAPSFRVYLAASDGSVSLNNTSFDGIFIWGAQLELGSTATTYYPTNINVPRFDWASTAQVARKNQFLGSQTFASPAWVIDGAVIAANAGTAPDGTNTATTIALGTGGNRIYQFDNTGILGTKTISLYAKANAGSALAVHLVGQYSNAATYTLNLSAGTFTPSIPEASLTSVGSGWYRFSITTTVGNASGNTTYVQLINTGASVFIWGVQVESSSSATSYFETGFQPTTNTPLAANTTSNGLLIEESRANRILWCRDATQPPATNWALNSNTFSAWTLSNTTATNNAATAPDSTTTAGSLVFANGVSGYAVSNSFNITSTYTAAVYVKDNGLGSCGVAMGSTTTGYVIDINLTTGAFISGRSYGGGSLIGYTITNVGSGWFFVTVTASAIAGGVFVGTASGQTGNGVNGVYVWRAQLLPGATATEYVATTSSSSTGWSKSNVTLAKDQTGVDGVANAATKVTASAANAVLIQPIILASGSRTGSVYLKRITGTGNVQVSLDGSTWSTVDLSSTEWRRIVLSGTVTNPVVGIRLATNGDAVAMDYAQVEDGEGASTPILTTTASSTRSADVAAMFFNSADCRVFDFTRLLVYTEFDITFRNGNANGNAVVSIGTNNNNIFYTLVGLDGRSNVGIVVPRASSIIPQPNTSYKIAASLFQGLEAGITQVNPTSTVNAVPYPYGGSWNSFLVPVDRMGVGCLQRNPTTSSMLNGRVKRIVFVKTILPVSALQVITGPAT